MCVTGKGFGTGSQRFEPGRGERVGVGWGAVDDERAESTQEDDVTEITFKRNSKSSAISASDGSHDFYTVAL